MTLASFTSSLVDRWVQNSALCWRTVLVLIFLRARGIPRGGGGEVSPQQMPEWLFEPYTQVSAPSFACCVWIPLSSNALKCVIHLGLFTLFMLIWLWRKTNQCFSTESASNADIYTNLTCSQRKKFWSRPVICYTYHWHWLYSNI